MYSRFQEKLREQRKNPETSRAGLKWESEEDCSLIDKIKSGKSIDEIAKEHQRTEGSIKTRLIIKAINEIDENNKTTEEAAAEFKIEVSDIEEYQKIKFEREQKQQLNATIRRRNNGYRNNNNTVVTLSTIHALLQQISNKLG